MRGLGVLKIANWSCDSVVFARSNLFDFSSSCEYLCDVLLTATAREFLYGLLSILQSITVIVVIGAAYVWYVTR